jgi:hypothetical protein
VRYGLIPDDPSEEAFLSSPIAPVVMIDSFVPLIQAMSLIVGSRRGVFEGLKDGPRAVDGLAESLGVDPGTLLLLLRVMTAAGYVVQAGPGSYGLSELGSVDVARAEPGAADRLAASDRAGVDDVPAHGRGADNRARHRLPR